MTSLLQKAFGSAKMTPFEEQEEIRRLASNAFNYGEGEANATIEGRDFDRLPYSHRARWLRSEAMRIGRIEFKSAGARRVK
jgi:hypothetical protein